MQASKAAFTASMGRPSGEKREKEAENKISCRRILVNLGINCNN
jgi:hypothetical protein